jgi:hypothetical protein
MVPMACLSFSVQRSAFVFAALCLHLTSLRFAFRFLLLLSSPGCLFFKPFAVQVLTGNCHTDDNVCKLLLQFAPVFVAP